MTEYHKIRNREWFLDLCSAFLYCGLSCKALKWNRTVRPKNEERISVLPEKEQAQAMNHRMRPGKNHHRV